MDDTQSNRTSEAAAATELVTNEATTTWKNLYEEHNKSLESSGNESGANVPRSIGHIGTRIFDKQFQEEEAVDFGATIDTHSAHISDSINNVNFSQHASFSTDDRKLPAPKQNFEMSEFTDHQSKLFGDDLAMPTMGEMSGRIDVNFSAVQTIGNAKDDLDEIQNDWKRARSIGVCPLMGRRSLSEYIEMDLDATHVTIKQDDDDMSITDTIHSPKVQHVSQNLSSALDKKASISNDWVADKENIALNPYITPKESINFAVNENSDKILVFDGKRLTIQSDKEADKILKGCTSKTVPKEAKTHQRKTIVLNVNDDLPNFKSTQGMMRNESSLAHERSRTLVYDDLGDISVTQAVPANIMFNDDKVERDRRRTMVYNDNEGNISITQAVPAKIVFNEQKAEGQRRRTMLYDDIEGNISITQAVPSKIVFNEPIEGQRRRTMLYDDIDIDLDTELTSVTDSGYELAKASAFSMDSRSHKSPAKLSDVEMPQEISFRPKRATPSPPVQDRVIVFDHYNPLNNILLAPIDYSHVHRYNPHKSNDTICADSQAVHSPKEVDSSEKKNTQFVGNVTVTHSMQPSGDSVPDKSDAQSLLSNASKPASVDESVSVRVCELKDTKVNTFIAMKGNKELLEASSSLTLVDDALAHNAFDVDLDMVTAESSSTNNAQGNSPVKVIYHNDESDVVLSEKVDSDLTSNDEMVEPVKMSTKAKKRNYSPTKKEKHKFSALSSLDVTPKPITKMQKMSNSPKYASRKDVSPEKLTAEKDENVRSKSAMDVDDSSDSKNASPKEHKRSPRKSKSPKSKKPGTSVTVQQLLTKYDIHPEIDQEALNKQIIQALSRSDSSTAPNTVSLTDVQSKSPDIVSSFTSSKNHNEMREASSVTTTESHTLSSSKSRSAKLEWQPESVNEKNVMSECDSSVNVVAKIDMLPFMGSHECEWEASGIDTWSFRLLHARLRLTARLAHRHDNATRTRVRADTPVRALSLDTAHQDKNNTVATLCVGFACEAMRYFTSRGCRTAGDVPALLKRCAGVARVALRWGRAMHEARLHLPYTLDGDRLALKVANIPLRSVWEVTMRLELVVEDAREVPWPRACDVRVSRVVSDVRVPEHEVKRALAGLPRDWGHVPRTVWKIFRYLKNKTREDDLLGV